MMKKRSGDTLVGILLAVAILGLLMTYVVSKVDIADVFAKLLTTEDQIAVRALGKAVTDYHMAHTGKLPGAITDTVKPICKPTISQAECDAIPGVLLNTLVEEGFIEKMPIHTTFSQEEEMRTGYSIRMLPSGRVDVTSPDPDIHFTH